MLCVTKFCQKRPLCQEIFKRSLRGRTMLLGNPTQSDMIALCLCSPDIDGRTPLHWAAYKGFAHSMRLLIVLDAQISAGDREGCTPLHWAAIRGNSEACTVLLQVLYIEP